MLSMECWIQSHRIEIAHVICTAGADAQGGGADDSDDDIDDFIDEPEDG